MLPATTTKACEDALWQSEFLRVSTGLRGVLILWVFAGHISIGATMNTQYLATLQSFNTAAFLILTGFSTYITTRNKPLQYGKWIMSRWFGLIPMYLLLLLTAYMPKIYQAAVSQQLAVSSGTQIYVLVMNVLGLSFIGDSGNFGFLRNATVFDTSADFGNVGISLATALSGNYFTSLLFCQLLLFALFHFTLSFQLPRRVFQAGYGLVAAIGAVGMIAASMAIAFFVAAVPNEISASTLAVVSYQNTAPATSLWMVPCVMFGVCVAEVRVNLNHRVKAVLGHWFVVDLSIGAFVAWSVMAHHHTASFGAGVMLRIVSDCKSPVLTAAQKAACGLFVKLMHKVETSQPTNSEVWVGVAVSAIQFVLFALMLLSLSCQVYHKKRSLAVFSVFQSRFMRFFGKHSYALYVVQIVVIFSPYMKWFLCFGTAAGTTCSAFMLGSSNFLEDWMYKVYLLVVTVVFALLVQRWQDTFVSACHVAVMEFLQPGIGAQCWKVLTDEQNPLSGLVLMWWPVEQTDAGEEGTVSIV